MFVLFVLCPCFIIVAVVVVVGFNCHTVTIISSAVAQYSYTTGLLPSLIWRVMMAWGWMVRQLSHWACTLIVWEIQHKMWPGTSWTNMQKAAPTKIAALLITSIAHFLLGPSVIHHLPLCKTDSIVFNLEGRWSVSAVKLMDCLTFAIIALPVKQREKRKGLILDQVRLPLAAAWRRYAVLYRTQTGPE